MEEYSLVKLASDASVVSDAVDKATSLVNVAKEKAKGSQFGKYLTKKNLGIAAGTAAGLYGIKKVMDWRKKKKQQQDNKAYTPKIVWRPQ